MFNCVHTCLKILFLKKITIQCIVKEDPKFGYFTDYISVFLLVLGINQEIINLEVSS